MVLPVVSEDVGDAVVGRFIDDLSTYAEFIEEAQAPHGLEILVADDLVTNQIVLRSMLEDLGHRVTIAHNGVEALAALEERRNLESSGERGYDLVLLDIQMSVMDGITATRTVRERENSLGLTGSGRLPILAVTAHAFLEDQARAVAAGADGVILKPIDERELRGAIERVCGRAEARHESALVEANLKNSTDLIDELLRRLQREEPEVCRAADIAPSDDGHSVLFDTARVRSICRGNVGRCVELLGSFAVSLEGLITNLRADIGSRDEAALDLTVHALKGTLGEMGCALGAERALAIASAFRRGDATAAFDTAQQLLRIAEAAAAVLSRAQIPSQARETSHREISAV